jgi:glycogen(starch) synthase
MSDICIVTKTWRYSIAWIVHSLAQALVDAGSSVCLIAPRSEPESREVHSPSLTRVFLARELVGPAGPPRRAFASMRRILGGVIATIAERRRTRNFLVTIPDPLFFSLPMMLILRLTGARILFLVHDAVPHAWRLPGWLQRIEHFIHGISYHVATELIVLTSALRTPLEGTFGIAPAKITVIPHGPLGIGALPPPLGAGRLFLFGSLRSNKSVLEVLEGVILARQTDPLVTLVIAGEPHPAELAYWHRCRAVIAQNPAAFDLHEGFIADEALPGLVASVDAFVLAYRRFNSQSGVGVLAALSGRPVLCTPIGGLQDLINEGLCHQPIEEPVSPATVSKAILAFRARSFEAWRIEAAVSTARFSESLSWEAIAKQFVERFRSDHT